VSGGGGGGAVKVGKRTDSLLEAYPSSSELALPSLVRGREGEVTSVGAGGAAFGAMSVAGDS
jgi:hypothetical protein